MNAMGGPDHFAPVTLLSLLYGTQFIAYFGVGGGRADQVLGGGFGWLKGAIIQDHKYQLFLGDWRLGSMGGPGKERREAYQSC